MQKWLLENYSFVSLAPFLTIKLKKKLQKECLNSSEASYNSRDEVICTQKIRNQVMIPEMMLCLHKNSGYDSRDDVICTQKIRL